MSEPTYKTPPQWVRDAPRRPARPLFALPLLALIAFLVADSGARAGGFSIPEIGFRRTAMGAVIGRPDDLSAVYHNPAGLTLLAGTHLLVAVGAAIPTTDIRLHTFDESYNGGSVSSSQYINQPVDAQGYYPRVKPSIAFGAIPLLAASTNIITNKLWAALSFYVPNAIGSAFAPDSNVRYHLVTSYLVAGYGGLSVAWKPLPWLSIGAGLSLIYVQLYGERRLFPVLNNMDLRSLLGSDTSLILSGNDLTWGWNAGVLIRPFSRLSIGATVISRSDATIRGDVTIHPSDKDTSLLSNDIRGTQTTQLLLPWTFMAGANLDLTDNVEIGFDFRYWLYSQLRNQHTDVSGMLASIIKSLDSPKNYRDSFHISGGVRVHDLAPLRETRFHGLELMMGAHYDNSPAPDSTVSLEQPSFNHVGVRGGVRAPFGAGDRFVVGLSYLHIWYLERVTTTSVTLPPSNFDASGENNFITLSLEVRLDKSLILNKYKAAQPTH